jgi:hypothetical protein
LIIRQDREVFDARDLGATHLNEKEATSDDKFFKDMIGQPIGLIDLDPSQIANIDKIVAKLDLETPNIDHQVFKINETRSQIVKVLHKRLINYPRMLRTLEVDCKDLIIKRLQRVLKSAGSAELRFKSMHIAEKMREAQKVLSDPKTANSMFNILRSNVSPAEINLILNLQPRDEPTILQDAANWIRLSKIKETASPIAKGLEFKRKTRVMKA